MLVLLETAVGYAIFKLLDEKKLEAVDNLFENFKTPDGANKIVQLQAFKKFVDSAQALEAGVAINEGRISKPLKKLLKKVFAEHLHEQLLVWDAKLGTAIKDKYGVSCMTNNAVAELMRCIKLQVEGLIPGLKEKELAAMSLGLAHNLARYKLKFSPDKVDTMIVQAVNLLDDIDKELNNYMMRAREWYGWHFPELSKIILDNKQYCQAILKMGMRDQASECDFSDIIPEDLEVKVKEAAEISMGTEITEDDMLNIHCLCEQVVELSTYRQQLSEYLHNRMVAIAPNVTLLVGELIGARLIAHAGSLLNLAKYPASTVQILGAEKALFRALKTRQSTPKYGLIYHAQLVTQSGAALKGKMSRMLAAKAALAIRYDALAEQSSTEMGINNQSRLAARLRMLESGHSRRISGKGRSIAAAEKYHRTSDVMEYDYNYDSTLKRKHKMEDGEVSTPKRVKVEKDCGQVDTPKHIKTEVKQEDGQESETREGSSPKKKKKKRKSQPPQEV